MISFIIRNPLTPESKIYLGRLEVRSPRFILDNYADKQIEALGPLNRNSIKSIGYN
jgi:hypothetical protein